MELEELKHFDARRSTALCPGTYAITAQCGCAIAGGPSCGFDAEGNDDLALRNQFRLILSTISCQDGR